MTFAKLLQIDSKYPKGSQKVVFFALTIEHCCPDAPLSRIPHEVPYVRHFSWRRTPLRDPTNPKDSFQTLRQTMTDEKSLYLGFDLSTQQLKGIAITSDLRVAYEAVFDFDADATRYGIKKGVLTNEAEREVYAPVMMWLYAIDTILQTLLDKGIDYKRVRGVSGAGQQHGSVYWSQDGEHALQNLHEGKSLEAQLHHAFSYPYSPNWQDASTSSQCELFDQHLGDELQLAIHTGSKAHHVRNPYTSGPQNDAPLSVGRGYLARRVIEK